MVQEIQVVQCYACQNFQTQISKKANKWICKLCGEKQSLKKIFGQGKASDCRAHCQRLNDLRRDKDKNYCDILCSTTSTQQLPGTDNTEMSAHNHGSNSKWTKYLSQSSTSDDDGLALSQASADSVNPPPAKKYREESGRPEIDKTTSVYDEFCSNINIPQPYNTNRACIGNGSGFNRILPGLDNFQSCDASKENHINEVDVSPGIFSANFNPTLEPELNILKYSKVHSSEEEEKSFIDELVPGTNRLLNTNTDISSNDETARDEKTVFHVIQHSQLKKVLSSEEELKKSVSLFENIDNYTVAELTDLCSL